MMETILEIEDLEVLVDLRELRQADVIFSIKHGEERLTILIPIGLVVQIVAQRWPEKLPLSVCQSECHKDWMRTHPMKAALGMTPTIF